MITPTYDTHRRRAVELDGISHAVRIDNRAHFTTACSVAGPTATILEAHGLRQVTCPQCLTVLNRV